ncbi:putative kinetochore protein spc24 [Exophiala dermatitidis]|uniref:Kinetochore protein Spc24 n=2 Tax=Exophiala dermatitidis TaxID=5970 RepID=H6BRW2_EXODN|nr:kinetochore protein spc24 [Exophiala dermatitidis NIH/UT8656]KAJ4507457.1 putative kinetochore protein spc24 [Exophiala dermatitidis]EHY54790.1 kinetochore protein spc24 [Exophiala dermatitidis NIH/UT8656]KAJ4521663.1 putative kinetochore protein spc24 [Exophiala dermatitidis]KAJ4531762.1 putative kinetochore protein spc24 [Exophiala dermatitidis]KAJ4545085.1 putative kinetochore protein spc24 [Exophiala dermatitidis]
MLLDEDPATLIRATVSNFNIAPDKAALSRVNDSLSTLQQSRELRIRDADTVLRKLSRQLATLSSQHREVLSSHDSGRHASEIVQLDTKKFRIAKQASVLEAESERLEAELESLKSRLADLEEQGVEGDENARRAREADDPTILRLWLYRSLGISLEQDEAGNYNKATIGNTKRGDVHVVNIDPKFSRWFYADYFWQTMQG